MKSEEGREGWGGRTSVLPPGGRLLNNTSVDAGTEQRRRANFSLSVFSETNRVMVAQRLARSPPTKAIRIQSLAGSLRIFAVGIVLDDVVVRLTCMLAVGFPSPSHDCGVIAGATHRTGVNKHRQGEAHRQHRERYGRNTAQRETNTRTSHDQAPRQTEDRRRTSNRETLWRGRQGETAHAWRTGCVGGSQLFAGLRRPPVVLRPRRSEVKVALLLLALRTSTPPPPARHSHPHPHGLTATIHPAQSSFSRRYDQEQTPDPDMSLLLRQEIYICVCVFLSSPRVVTFLPHTFVFVSLSCLLSSSVHIEIFPCICMYCGNTWAAVNNEVLRSDECEATRVWSSARMQGWGKQNTPEKTRRPVVSSGMILTFENPGVTKPTMAEDSLHMTGLYCQHCTQLRTIDQFLGRLPCDVPLPLTCEWLTPTLRGDRDVTITFLIASTREALNWRAVSTSPRDFQRKPNHFVTLKAVHDKVSTFEINLRKKVTARACIYLNGRTE
ncbi:hypothetical protein PR048_031868 [Dryococelus australis]|uniref:Uncharacterized protein n=1 Tax=Dryococelus australis TaxID=614101 RepID=A0ABQ9G6H7_9NEOP|nr:hypothetical protein PR048_031868 [Dryococelus australis]